MERGTVLITLDEARKALQINKDELDEVVLHHAGLYDEVAESHVRAVSNRDYLKDEMGKAHAEVANDIRAEASEKGEKITKDAVEAATILDKEYIAASEEYGQAKLEADLWGVMKDSFLQRSSMIKRLCDLHKEGYYTTRTVEGVAEAGKELTHEGDRKALGKSRRARKRRD